MKRFSKLFPVITVCGGFCAAILRHALLASVNDRGLLPAGTPTEMFLNIQSVLILAGLAVILLKWKNRDFRTYLSFPVQAIGCAGMAFIMIFTAASEAIPLFFALRALTGICFLMMAFFRLKRKKPPLLVPAVIAMCLMVLCFGQYRVWSQNTQLHTYLFPALAALLTALYSLEYAYLETREGSCKRAFFLNQAALFCNLACIGSDNWLYHLPVSLWLVTGLFTTPNAMELPEAVLRCITCLQQEGYTAYAVGGCVRDGVMGLKPHDYDLCTGATPEEICRVFGEYKLIRNGEKHGTVGVIIDGSVYEITTYRTEGEYGDNRHPDEVEFVDNIEEDLSRRDFTVNAMAYHPNSGYFDPYGGQRDILSHTLRTVGDPETRFKEDALRILRGVRFACRFRLNVEEKTITAMEKLAPLQDNLARERVYSELTQLLCYVQTGDLLRFAPVILQIIPELAEAVGFQQHSVYHAYDVFTHTEMVVTATEPCPALRWAALLHDVGKPQTFQKDEKGHGHFYGHAKVSADMANGILERLKAPTALREQVVFLIAHHMDTLSADTHLLTKKLSRYGAENVKMLAALQMADDGGKGKKRINTAQYEKILKAIKAIEEQGACLQIRDLAVDGHDLMALGFEAGPKLGHCQKQLLELVLDGKLPNEKEALLQKAEEILKQ